MNGTKNGQTSSGRTGSASGKPNEETPFFEFEKVWANLSKVEKMNKKPDEET